MTRAYLFIGGSQDGQWRDVSTRIDRLKVPLTCSPISEAEREPSVYGPKIEIEEYDLQKLRGHKGAYSVYCLKGIDGDGLIQMLLAGYLRKPQVAAVIDSKEVVL